MVLYISKAQYPQKRLRRLRQNTWIRELVQETSLTVTDLIWPIFVREESLSPFVSTLPDVERFGLDTLIPAVQQAYMNGIRAIALFPAIKDSLKNPEGTEAYNPDNLICQAIRAIKDIIPEIGIITDVALDPYTSHGHDGIIHQYTIDNDLTIVALCKQALVQANAGADIIAPSDMMDGRVQAIRQCLDSHGFTNVMILSYAVKYSSAFYGPFRDAVGVSQLQEVLDKKTYQVDPANAAMGIHEAGMDIDEGADMVIVKPGMPYLDIVWQVKQMFGIPTFAYQVSGEYAMLKNAATVGILDWDKAIMESLLCFKRAGADAILTYAAPYVAQSLQSK